MTVKFRIRVENGSDDPDNLGHLGRFFSVPIGSHPQTKLSGCDLGYLVDHVSIRIMVSGRHGSSEGESTAESDDIHEITLPLSVSKRLVADLVLKLNRKLKGSRALDQFWILIRIKKCMVLLLVQYVNCVLYI